MGCYISEAHLRFRKIDAANREAIDWLSQIDHTVYHQEACKEHLEMTGEWIFEYPDFVSWRQAESALLWLCGPGKVIYWKLIFLEWL